MLSEIMWRNSLCSIVGLPALRLATTSLANLYLCMIT